MAIRESYRWRSKSPGDGGQRILLSRRMLLGLVSLRCLTPQASRRRTGVKQLRSFVCLTSPRFQTICSSSASISRSRVSPPPAGDCPLRAPSRTPLEMSLDDISAAPRKTLPVTLECAENPVGGGLVSHAEWTGAAAGIVPRKSAAASPSRLRSTFRSRWIHTQRFRSAKAMHPDTLLAYSMNGEKLLAKHGLPLRAIIPGWYGMDSVKWLREISVLTEPDATQGQYVRLTKSLLAGTRPSGAITTMNVKSAFSRPVRWRHTSGPALHDPRRRVVGRESDSRGRGEHGCREDLAESRAERIGFTLFVGALDARLENSGRGEHELVVRASDDQGRSSAW